VCFTCFTLGAIHELNQNTPQYFCQFWKSKLLLSMTQFLSHYTQSSKLQLPGNVKAVLTRSLFPLLVWFDFATREVMVVILIVPCHLNRGNNCQPAWTVMRQPRKTCFNHGPCISIQAPAVEHWRTRCKSV
jgi:hypothetical protein